MDRTARVFLVDDDEDDCYLACSIIWNAFPKCRLSYFNWGRELIDALESMPLDQYPSLIVLDLNMPVMNGFETLAVLKADERWKNIPVVIFTTSFNYEERRRALAMGADFFMSKPADNQEAEQTRQDMISFLNTRPVLAELML